MEQHEFLAFGIAVGLLVVCLLIFFWRLSSRDESIEWCDLLLVWPLIFKLDKRSKRPTSTRFVVIGLVLGLTIVVLAVKFT